MRRGLLLAGLAVLATAMLVPGAGASAPWTQAGHDAARTGRVPVEGPDRPDVAFQVELPGDLARGYFGTPGSNAPYAPGGPVLVDGSAYVPLRDMAVDDGNGSTPDGVVRVDLSTAEVTPVLSLEEGRTIQRIASGGGHLIVVSTSSDPFRAHVAAYDMSGEEKIWNWSTSIRTAVRSYYWWCAQPAVADGTVFASCTAYSSPYFTPFIVALDSGTGQAKWYWSAEAENPEGKPDALPGQTLVLGLTAAGDHLYAASVRRVAAADVFLGCGAGPCSVASTYSGNLTLFAFSRGEESLQWTLSRESRKLTIRSGPEERSVFGGQLGGSLHPAGTPRKLFLRWEDNVAALNPGQEGEVLWKETVGEGDIETNLTLGSFALDGDSLYATSTQTVYRFDRENPSDQWETSLNPAFGEVFDNAGALVLGQDTLYAVSHSIDGNGSSVYALDPDTGDVRWRHRMPAAFATVGRHYHSLGEGFLAAAGTDGTFHVLGETPASIGPFVTADDRYAGVGEPLTVDLSGTGPGALGPATRYKAEWGDGNVTGWREAPTFTHAYEETGEFTARVHAANDDQTATTTLTVHVGVPAPATEERLLGDHTVSLDLSGWDFEGLDEATRYRVFWGDGNVTGWREDPNFDHTYAQEGNVTARIQAANDANETASRLVTMRVGQSPPPEPNLAQKVAQKALAPGNQDITFGVLGIAMAVTGGVVGAARRYQKRNRLERELEALEQGFEETRDHPSECESFLDDRKGRARSLAVDGVLKEEQVAIIENRAEELRGELRVSTLDERFAFLPHGMVQTLERMLEDGRINAWEKETFLDALDEQEMLTEEQKGKVERLVGQWLDEGGSV